MKQIASVVTALTILVFPVITSAASYLDNSTLAEKVRDGVRDCRGDAKTFDLPLITWGADIVTINANGGDIRTKKGSALSNAGLSATLKRKDVFADQVSDYLTCRSPFLRATLGMAAMAADRTESDPRTKMVAVYQHSWSAGGDALVAKSGIRNAADLRGKTIVLQKFGPHVDYLMKVLSDANLSPGDVKIKWVKDLTGTDNSPASAFINDSAVDAAMVIIPDALALTSDGSVGTGSEGSVKGATMVLSTKSANRIISDMYFVRKDFYDANKGVVERLVKALLSSEEETRAKARNGGANWSVLMKESAGILLDDDGAVADAKGLWGDAETTGRNGNVRFFTDYNWSRNFANLAHEVQGFLREMQQLSKSYRLSKADWDFKIIAGASGTASTSPRFNTDATNKAVTRMHAQGNIDDGTLITFEIFFRPNQNAFSADVYAEKFDQVIELAETYAGAVITVEGHADSSGYVRGVVKGLLKPTDAKRQVQAARNLSVRRAQAVRDAIISHGQDKGKFMDISQFVTVGMGYSAPTLGMCQYKSHGMLPCYPKNNEERLKNMRVQFRLVNVEAESDAFIPLN